MKKVQDNTAYRIFSQIEATHSSLSSKFADNQQAKDNVIKEEKA